MDTLKIPSINYKSVGIGNNFRMCSRSGRTINKQFRVLVKHEQGSTESLDNEGI